METKQANKQKKSKNRRGGDENQTGSTNCLNDILKTRLLKFFVSRPMAKILRAQANRPGPLHPTLPTTCSAGMDLDNTSKTELKLPHLA